MLGEVAGFIGGKLIEKVFEDSLDVAKDKLIEEKIKKEYERVKKEIYNTLISENIEQSYFEILQRLLDETKIIEVLFSFSYLISSTKKLINKSRILVLN